MTLPPLKRPYIVERADTVRGCLAAASWIIASECSEAEEHLRAALARFDEITARGWTDDADGWRNLRKSPSRLGDMYRDLARACFELGKTASIEMSAARRAELGALIKRLYDAVVELRNAAVADRLLAEAITATDMILTGAPVAPPKDDEP